LVITYHKRAQSTHKGHKGIKYHPSCPCAAFVSFVVLLISTHWRIIVGLLIGGVIAAPLAAFVCKKLPTRVLMALVGVLIIILSIRTIYLSLA
jgi:uncharacterized membrane protein YfcA